MRPVKLTLQAFGPYADNQVIDFQDSVMSGLFGIYGPTGSGKSSIFSAMTFALFGESAKPDQEIASFRSDHAETELPTEVEFIFDVGEKRYLIRRRPEQMRPKHRGGGETRDPHEAWLFDVTGIAVEELAAGKSGKIIAEKKIGIVKEAVIELLGYGPDQFTQVILLPQGKFETFLSAKTNKRLEILRELFDVSIYQQISARLRDDARGAELEVKQAREVCSRRLLSDGFESPDALTLGIETTQQETDELRAAEQLAEENVDKAQKELGAARELNQKFVDAETAGTYLSKLQARSDEIDVLKKQVGRAKKALAMADVESHLVSTSIEVAKASQHLANAESQSEKADAAALRAAAALEQERARSDEITELVRKGDELIRHQQSFEKSIGFRDKAARAATSLSTAKTALKTADASRKRLGEEKVGIQAALSHARAAEAERGKIQIQISSAETSHKAAVQYEQAFTAVTDAQTAVTTSDVVHKNALAALSDAEQSFSAAEANLSEAQALHLSAKLTDGQPCPVCGSSRHPAPAIGSIENAGFDQAFRIAKTSLSEARTLSQEAVKSFSSADATLKERSQVLSAMDKPTQSAAECFNHLSQLRGALEVSALASTSANLEVEIENLDVKIQSNSAEIERFRTAREEAATAVAVTAQQLSQALDGIPETLRDAAALQQAIAENEHLRTTRQNALTQAESSDRKLREAALVAKKDVEAGKLARSETLNRQQAAKKVFDSRLHDSGLTKDAYEDAKARLETVDFDQNTINKYAEELAIASNQVKVTKLAIADQPRPELQNLIDATTEAKDALSNSKTVLADAQAKLKAYQKLRSEISEELARLDKFEHDTAPLRELAAMFNAENPFRLDLETYAIGAMFDQVLTAANRRLEPMTSGRFSLEREIEEGKGRARRGLGIRVHDVHTGKARATATLSGGETFMAALSLALGLSDIVEASAGNIRLDTIFIDEGFGSLDTENDSGTLDQVLQTLTNLVSQNRAVGLISHVPLVQQTIPNGFYIRKTLTGSHIETRGVL